MENLGELSRRELLGLKEVQLKGRSTDRTLAFQLINDDLIIGSPGGYLKLTGKETWPSALHVSAFGVKRILHRRKRLRYNYRTTAALLCR
jgi:hypothetical protein